MAKCWLVTTGSYSDYKVEAVFTTEAMAKQYIAMWPKGYDTEGGYHVEPDVDIQTCSLDEFPGVPAGMIRYSVAFDREGNCEVKHVNPGSGNETVSTCHGRDPRLWTFCWARDEKHAAKIANERRVQAIASGEWDKRLANKEKMYKRHDEVMKGIR